MVHVAGENIDRQEQNQWEILERMVDGTNGRENNRQTTARHRMGTRTMKISSARRNADFTANSISKS